MTDYGEQMRRPLPKRVAIWLLEIPWINALVVSLLRCFKKARWRHRVPVMGRVGRISLPGGTELEMLNPARCNVAREIFWHDGKLPDAADNSALELAIALSKDAEYFLDIGSYTGLFALAVARCNPVTHCHAFEIVPENFLLLWQNVIHNNLISRVNVVFKGVSDAPGLIRLPLSLDAGLLPSSVALDSDSPGGAEVPVDSIDRMFGARDGAVVLKIDVEAYEWKVLSGARGLIENTRPDIICEFLTRAPDIAMVIDYLVPLGYDFYRITGEGLVRSDTIIPVKTERDWLLTTRQPPDIEAIGWTVF